MGYAGRAEIQGAILCHQIIIGPSSTTARSRSNTVMLKVDSPARSNTRPARGGGSAAIAWSDLGPLGNPARRAAVILLLVLLAVPVTSSLRAAPLATDMPAVHEASGQTTQDLNGDGMVDAVFTQKQRFNQVCFGNGTGAFTSCTDLIGSGSYVLSNQVNTTASALVDWNNDGFLDIALAMEGRSSVVCYNAGAGQFNSGLGCVEVYGYSSFPYDSQDVAVGDVNADGAPDLVFANGGNAGTPLAQENLVCLGTNTGGSTCSRIGTSAVPSTGVALGDVDNDTDLDVIVSNRGSLNEVCLNSGNGTTFDCRAIPQAGNVSATKHSNAVAVGNLPNGFSVAPDAFLDVVFANTGMNERCFGDGNWAGANVGLACGGVAAIASYTSSDAAAKTTDVILADTLPITVSPVYVGDEILFVNEDAPNVHCFGAFTCTFNFNQREHVTVNIGGTNYVVSEPVVEATTGVAVRDINIDGRLDVVVANTGLTGGVSRTYRGAAFDSLAAPVANNQFYPTSVTLSGGNVGPALDTAPPAFIGATNRTAEATGPTGATVAFTVTAQDVVDGTRSVSCNRVSGSLFVMGNTTVTCTASDTSNNVGTASFVVSVVDTTGPVVTVPGNISVLATPGQTTAVVAFVTTAIDAVDGNREAFCYNTATNSGVSSGAHFAGGTTTLMCGSYDSRNNYNQVSFTVTVTTDIDIDGILDDVDLDDDGDGIADTVDVLPIAYSSEYRFDATNTGIVERNGWTVTVTPTAVGSSYNLRATLSGAGSAPAIVPARCGALRKELRLNAVGDTIDWRCILNFPLANSLAVNFVSGTTQFWKATGGAWIRITPTAGNTAATSGSPVTADAANTAPVLVTIFNELLLEVGAFSLAAGESVAVDVVDVDGKATLRLELLNGGSDGVVEATLFGQPVTLQGGAPVTAELNPDVTAPVIEAQVSGTLGSNGYYRSDVTVTWTVTDAESAATTSGCDAQSVVQDTAGVTFTCSAESEGGTATQSVTIKRDATAPEITVPGTVTAQATGATGAVATYVATVLDLLDGTPSLSCAPASGSMFPVGSTTVACTASDAAGNTASASFTVTVANTAPTFTAPANQTVEATSAAGAVVAYVASATDVEDGSITAVCAPASGSTFPLGTTTVNCTATDTAGATTPGSFTVTVVDTTAPSIAATANISVAATSAAGAAVTYAAPATTDLVNGTGAATCAPVSGSTFGHGATSVTCTATDAAGNSASSTFTVTVTNIAPTFTAPADQTVEATGAAGAVVTYAASGADVEDGTIAAVCAPASGATFALGTTTVNCTATDTEGVSATGSFTVTVVDTTAPSIAATANISVAATSAAGAAVTYAAPATTDLVNGTGAATCAPTSGSTFAAGATTVTCTATDVAGNSASSTFTVTVTNTVPTFTAPVSQTVEAASAAGAVVTYAAAGSDVEDGTIAAVCAPASGSTFQLGTTSVTCTVTDNAGASVSGTFTVLVVDTTAPSIATTANIAVTATSAAGAAVTYTTPATTDLVNGTGAATCTPASGSTFAVGSTTVACTATDAAGNAASSTFVVTVTDATPPPSIEDRIRAIAGSSADQLIKKYRNIATAPNANAMNGRVTAYKNQVNAQLKSRKITAAQAAELIALLD